MWLKIGASFATPSLIFLFLLTGCVTHRLSVQTHYLNRENLASYYVNTPDPHLDCPVIGQRMMVQWSFPDCYFDYPNLKIELIARFRNHKEANISFQPHETRGTYLYYLVNDAYRASGGLATYKVDVIADGCVLETWKHPLWVELITFDSQDLSSS